MKSSILPLLAAITLSGCSSDTGGVDDRALRDNYFVLRSVDGQPVTAHEGIRPNLRFEDGLRVSGVMCNRFFGQGRIEQGQLRVPQLASTRMLCHDDVLNQWEQTLSQMLSSGVKMAFSQQTLTLSGSGHTLVYQAERYPAGE